MSAFAIVKGTVQVVAALGVTRVVAEVIKNNTTVVTTVDKILVNTGGLVLGSIIVDYASDRVNLHIDKFAEWSEKRKAEIEAAEVEVAEEVIEDAEKKEKNGNKNAKDSN
jgi:hypothetical protein